MCTINECAIGQHIDMQPIESIHDLPQITLELLSSLNSLNKQKDSLIDITADGKISDDEQAAFEDFKNSLADMTLAIESLRLWTEKYQ